MAEREFPPPPLHAPFERLPQRHGGYERQATRELFEELADYYEALWLECARLREVEANLLTELEGRRAAEPSTDAALAEAAETAAAIREEAHREALLALRKVRKRAEKEARRIERNAAVSAAEIVEHARRERREIEREIARMGRFANETRDELSSFLMAALEWYRRGRDGRVLDAQLPLEVELEQRAPSAPTGAEPSPETERSVH